MNFFKKEMFRFSLFLIGCSVLNVVIGIPTETLPSHDIKHSDDSREPMNDETISDTSFKTASRIAELKCREYTKLACHRKSSDTFTATTKPLVGIEGGIKALPKQYPHMALLGYLNKKSSVITWECGGSLISENFILTAAHCLVTSSGAKQYPVIIRLGELDYSTNEDDATPTDYEVGGIFVHPNYSSSSYLNDIALVKFRGVPQFTDYIRPICLNTLKEFGVNIATVTGWGSTVYGGPKSTSLLAVDLPIQSAKKCEELYAMYKFDKTTQICVGDLSGGKDACKGDSGGPLQIPIRNSKAECSKMYEQVGIVSYGIRCGLPDRPAVYTRVSHFLPWIEQIVWPSNLP